MSDDLVMRLLADDVPLTLLIDLLRAPESDEVYSVEGGDAAWLPPAAGAA